MLFTISMQKRNKIGKTISIGEGMPVQAEEYREYLISVMCWLSEIEMLLPAPCRTGQVLITVIDMKMKLNPPKQKRV